MSDPDLDMGKKRSRQQSSNVAVTTADSSESGDGAVEKVAPNKTACSHVTKSIDVNQIKKQIGLYANGKKVCTHCKDINEEDKDKNIEGNEDFWVCLRCGAKTCSLEHSSSHYDVPRSDSHALTLKIPAFSVWCHACKGDLPSDYSKKLKTCISSVEQFYKKQISLQLLAQQESLNSSKTKDENENSKETKLTEPIPLPLPKKVTPITNTAPAVRGLTNLGNTCFFNSVLQCLAQTPGLVEAIREMSVPEQEVDIVLKDGVTLTGKLGQWDSLSESLADTLIKLQSGGPVVSPDRLLSLLTKKQTQFQGYRQHDAHELFTYLIDSVRMTDHKRYRKLILSEFGLYGKHEQNVSEETTKKLKALDHEITETVIFAPEKVFKGRLVNRIECQECRSVKTFEESFLDLSLPIVTDKPQPPCMRRKGGHQQSIQNQSQLDVGEEGNKSSINNNNNATGPTMSKSQMKKEDIAQRRKNRKQGKKSRGNVAKVEDISSSGITGDLKDNEEHQGSDVDGDVEDNSEETNCGSKESTMSKENRHENGADTESVDVNCGNQGVWQDSNEVDKTNSRQEDINKIDSSTQQYEDEKQIMCDLLGLEDDISSPHDKENSNSKQSCGDKTEKLTPSSYHFQNNHKKEIIPIECSEKDKICEAQVTAWLNTSSLVNAADPEETDIGASPLHDHGYGEINEIGIGIVHNRLSPQAQTSVCSNQQSSQHSLDETRSSLLTVTQETQESGYCSEKLGCPESPQREGSPCSLDGFSTLWSVVEGTLSSRSDVSVEETFNNTGTLIAEEGDAIEYPSYSADTQADSDTTKITNVPKDSWLSSCHPPAHVRRRSLSPPSSVRDSTLKESNSTPAIESAIMCSKWLEDSLNVSNFEETPDVLRNEKLQVSEGKKRNKKVGNILGDIYERDLGDIPEEEINIGTNLEVVYGPLNKDQLMMGDHDVSDHNSTKQGSIARPASPNEECNEVDLKLLQLSTFNVEDSSNSRNQDVEKSGNNPVQDKVSDTINVRGGGGGDKTITDIGLNCGCNRTSQKQDSMDSCCLHTSLGQSTQAELMTGCNKIVCDNCSSGNAEGKSVYTNSTKQTLISQAPPALVIHLKRFQVQMMTCRKLCRHVSFPLHLDLAPYSSISSVHVKTNGNKKLEEDKESLIYTLYGLVEHSGTMNGGHYVAYVKIARDSRDWWYCISDSHVSQVTESRVLSAQAYLLFYKRVSPS